ncbi:hypothetical protein [Burkholderia sp. ISTR5]|uniref:hypothetical protein n=1 Tax=Burkholderia sp. ISTR5 TaxID=2500161 RepID=UPI001368ACF7|nr:hypothetical protein [Burkholderia sp. ISTR5]NBI45434.1 hypothetical protein [Burkholderia sp. ISTR5]
MRVVLLGAGASYGSGDVHPHPPPLGAALFPALEAVGGVFAEMPERLKEEFRKDFETAMGQYFEEAGSVMEFQRGLAKYFSQFTPGPNNEYMRMIRTLGVTRYIYITLNYDLLLEESAAMCGCDGYYGIKRDKNTINVIKPHGSCNFWPDMLGVLKGVFMKSREADVIAPVKPLDRQDTIKACETEDSLSPAIAMYAKGKGAMVCPGYVKTHQELMSKAFSDASRIYISGVRVVAEDVHIWDQMARSKAKITYFGSERSGAEFIEWAKSRGRTNAFFVEANFSECIEKIASLN